MSLHIRIGSAAYNVYAKGVCSNHGKISSQVLQATINK